jgi:hypothetical protein
VQPKRSERVGEPEQKNSPTVFYSLTDPLFFTTFKLCTVKNRAIEKKATGDTFFLDFV